MLHQKYILMKAKTKVNSNNQLNMNDYFLLFGSLSEEEQEEVDSILEDSGIECVIDKNTESTNDYYKSKNLSNEDHKEFKNLTNEQLCILYQNGNEYALEALLNKNRRYLYKKALQFQKIYKRSNFTIEDFFQEGAIGFINAAQRFKSEKETKFITYATFWIEQNMGRAVVDSGYTIRIPVHMFELISKVSMFRKKNPLCTMKDVAMAFNLSIDRVVYLYVLIENYISLASLNIPVKEDGDTELGELVIDKNQEDILDIVSQRMMQDKINEVLQALTIREIKALQLRFGLEDGRTRTLEEVGQHFGVTRERIRQIEAKALRKLRHPSRAKQLKDFLD